MTTRKLRAIVTAGSTVIQWDEVRVFEMLPYLAGDNAPILPRKVHKVMHCELRNIFRGKLGMNIAEVLASLDIDTTLIARKDLLAPDKRENRPNYSVEDFYTFDDLYGQLERLIPEVKPDIIFMAAAVSDYTMKPESGKISSDHSELTVTFVRSPKILDNLRRWSGPETLICGFKLLVGVPEAHLIEVSKRQIERANTDLCVANDFRNIDYKHDYHPAMLVSKSGEVLRLGGTKKVLAESLVRNVVSRLH